jgi:hypothetical protein
MDATFLRRFSIAALLLACSLFTACTGGYSTPLDGTAGAYGTTTPYGTTAPYGTTTPYGTTGTLGTNTYSTSTLPPNLFNAAGTDTAPYGTVGTLGTVGTVGTGTPGYVAPVGTTSTSTALAYPLTQLQAQCLQSPTTLFNGVSGLAPTSSTYSYPYTNTTSSTCYTGTPITQASAYALNLSNLNTSNTCLQIALAMQPTSDDPTTVQTATVQAELAILRCVQYQVQQAQGLTTWNTNQAQVYSNTNSQLYSYLAQLGQQFPTVPAYTGPLAQEFGFGATAH